MKLPVRPHCRDPYYYWLPHNLLQRDGQRNPNLRLYPHRPTAKIGRSSFVSKEVVHENESQEKLCLEHSNIGLPIDRFPLFLLR